MQTDLSALNFSYPGVKPERALFFHLEHSETFPGSKTKPKIFAQGAF
jgi:hypothetical protein